MSNSSEHHIHLRDADGRIDMSEAAYATFLTLFIGGLVLSALVAIGATIMSTMN